MDIIKCFECHTPLFERDKFESQFLNVSDFKRIKFMFFTDSPLIINLISSYDGISPASKTVIMLEQKRYWKDYVFNIAMDYLKILVEKPQHEIKTSNNELHIVPRGFLLRGVSIPKKELSKESQKQEESPKEPLKDLPQKRSFIQKLSSPNKDTLKSSIELPHLCLPNQLFICGKNKINLLPPPDKQGQVLTFDGNTIKWI